MYRATVIVFFSIAAIACAQAPDYTGTVLTFVKHKNDGDLESAMSMFADEPSLQFGPLGTITGLSEVRGILEYDLAINTDLQIDGCEASGSDVTCLVVETNDWLKLADIESITYDENRFTFTSDGRIKSLAATLSSESGQLLGATMSQFDEWARTNQPVAYGDLFSEEGAFVYSHENADKVLKLLRIWRNK